MKNTNTWIVPDFGETSNNRKIDAHNTKQIIAQAQKQGYDDGLQQAKSHEQEIINCITRLNTEISNINQKMTLELSPIIKNVITVLFKRISQEFMVNNAEYLNDILSSCLAKVNYPECKVVIFCSEKLYKIIQKSDIKTDNISLKIDSNYNEYNFCMESSFKSLEYDLEKSICEVLASNSSDE